MNFTEEELILIEDICSFVGFCFGDFVDFMKNTEYNTKKEIEAMLEELENKLINR